VGCATRWDSAWSAIPSTAVPIMSFNKDHCFEPGLAIWTIVQQLKNAPACKLAGKLCNTDTGFAEKNPFAWRHLVGPAAGG